jgi:hypothetical protein
MRGVQHFAKRYSCHLQGEYVLVGHLWQAYIGQRVGRVLDVMELIGGVKEKAASQ